jgi:hypothetical protein
MRRFILAFLLSGLLWWAIGTRLIIHRRTYTTNGNFYNEWSHSLFSELSYFDIATCRADGEKLGVDDDEDWSELNKSTFTLGGQIFSGVSVRINRK